MWTALIAAVALFSWATLPPLWLRYRHASLSPIPTLSLLRFSLSVRLHSLVLWVSGVSRSLPSLPAVEELPGFVVRVLGNNPSRMTLTGTNVYLVGAGNKRILIDSSDGNTKFVSRLLQVCEAHGVNDISDLLVTHGHLDHVGGLLQLMAKFPHIKVWKCLPRNDRRLKLSNEESRQLGIRALPDGKEFTVPLAGESVGTLRVVYTPGHCDDHVCFLLEVKELDGSILFSGDCVLGCGSCMFDSLGDLMTSLNKLRDCGAVSIYPGHGPAVLDAPAKIDEYISHRQQREDEVVEVLKDASKGLSSAEIVAKVYEPLPYILRLSARKAIEKHLQKLLEEKRIRQTCHAGWFQAASYSLN